MTTEPWRTPSPSPQVGCCGLFSNDKIVEKTTRGPPRSAQHQTRVRATSSGSLGPSCQRLERMRNTTHVQRRLVQRCGSGRRDQLEERGHRMGGHRGSLSQPRAGCSEAGIPHHGRSSRSRGHQSGSLHPGRGTRSVDSQLFCIQFLPSHHRRSTMPDRSSLERSRRATRASLPGVRVPTNTRPIRFHFGPRPSTHRDVSASARANGPRSSSVGRSERCRDRTHAAVSTCNSAIAYPSRGATMKARLPDELHR